MRIKLGGSMGKCWEFDDVKSLSVTEVGQGYSAVNIKVEKDGLIYNVGFNEAGVIRIDNRKPDKAEH